MIPKTRKEAFEVLRLSENANKQEIKKAYHKLALKWHPDKWSDKSQEEQKTATEKAKEITIAHKILTNEITEEFISQQTDDDWVDACTGGIFGSHLNSIEIELFIALANGFLKQVELLLPKIKNPNVKSRPGGGTIEDKAPLHYIVSNACKEPNNGWETLLRKFLSDNDAGTDVAVSSSVPRKEFIDIDIGDQSGTTPLHIASKYGHTDLINILLKCGADVNKLNELRSSPLHQAADCNNAQAVKLLLENGAKISNGEKCIMLDDVLYGLVKGEYSTEVTTMLLGKASTEEKNKIFLESCKEGEVELVSKLLSEYGVNPNLISIDGCATVLQDICCRSDRSNSVKVAGLLLQAGADQTLVVGTWPSALEIVQQQENKEFIELFAQYKSKTDSSIQNTNNYFQPTVRPGMQGAQPPITDNTKYNSRNSGRRWTIIVPALLFGAIGATLAAMGIIPEIAAIGMIATVVLSGIVGAIVGGVAGYLVDVAINQCCGNVQAKLQATTNT
ncbi:MAG: ankyrin repeat domain-containing protein [Wolbachia sp.]